MLEPCNIVIPYNHEHLSANCDFIFKTASEFLKRGENVYFIPRLHRLVGLPFFAVRSQSDDEVEITLRKNFEDKYQKQLYVCRTRELVPRWARQQFGRAVQLDQAIDSLLTVLIIRRIQNAIIWSFDHQNYDLFEHPLLRENVKIYDCVDYYTSSDKNEAKIIQSQEAIQAKLANHIYVNSTVLKRKFKCFYKKLTLVPQGFDLESFSKSALPSVSFDELKKLEGKKVAIIANLTYRFDYHLLYEVIKNNKNITFVISSSRLRCEPEDTIHETDKQITRLTKLSNVFWLPQLNRRQLKKILELVDLCTIPYDVNMDFNLYSFPMKLFEYFYLGKPVLSTGIKELEQYKPYCVTLQHSQEWTIFLNNRLYSTWPQEYSVYQRKLAEKNSWEEKINAMKYRDVISRHSGN